MEELVNFSQKIIIYSFNQFNYKNLSQKIKLVLEDNKSHEVGIENLKFIKKKLNGNDLKQKFIDIYESN